MRLIPQRKRPSRKRWAIPAAAGSVLAETGATWLRSRRLGGNLVVRCREGHLFTTLWIPAVSLKSLRFGFWRFQHCPVGHHWTVITPVEQSRLSEAERRDAAAHHDIGIP